MRFCIDRVTINVIDMKRHSSYNSTHLHVPARERARQCWWVEKTLFLLLLRVRIQPATKELKYSYSRAQTMEQSRAFEWKVLEQRNFYSVFDSSPASLALEFWGYRTLKLRWLLSYLQGRGFGCAADGDVDDVAAIAAASRRGCRRWVHIWPSWLRWQRGQTAICAANKSSAPCSPHSFFFL